MESTNSLPETKNTRNKRVKVIVAAVILVALLAIAGTVLWQMGIFKQETEQAFPERAFGGMNLEGVITASGLTSVAMQDEMYELDFLETALYVEESYLSTGDQVAEDTKVFKVSEDTLKEASRELNDAVTETGLAYRQGKIDYEIGLLDASEAQLLSGINQKYAQSEYDKAMAEAAAKVTELEQQVEDARELVEEYTASVQENYYYTYYKVKELQDTYYDNFTYQMKLYEEWNIEELEDTVGTDSSSASGNVVQSGSTGNTAGGTGGDMAGNAAIGKGNAGGENEVAGADNVAGGAGNAGAGNDGGGTGNTAGGTGSTIRGMGSAGASVKVNQDAERMTVYNLLDELVQENGAAYQEALEQYQEASAVAAAGLDRANSELLDLEAQLVQARTEYQQATLTNQADFDITMAENENAQQVYDTTSQKLEETYATLADDKDEAEENLTLFDQIIADGYFYTENAGNIVMVGVRKGSYLSGESLLLAYSDPETVTVTANVGQEDIADITVDDRVYVTVEGYGSYEGHVRSINPVSQSQSNSSITYQVMVNLEGDFAGLESNLTAYVHFGMTSEQWQGIQQMPSEDNAGQPQMPSGDNAGQQ